MSEVNHTTRSAARLLGVSEASVRRWSDAGLLPVTRLGRRGARRFAETDLRDFAAKQSLGAGEPARHSARMRVHDHFATFYDSDAARMRLSLPFLRAGLMAGDKCFLVGSQSSVDEYMVALSNDGDRALDDVLERGDLVVRATVGSFARDAIAGWQDAWLQALSMGRRTIRVVGEMSTYADLMLTGELLDYEVAYDNLSKRFPVMTLCQYDVRHFSGEGILGATRAHPDLFSKPISDFIL